MKILLVAENCSRRMGGEAILPYHYFRLLNARGHEVQLLVHERNAGELEGLFPLLSDRIHYIKDSPAQKAFWKIGCLLPRRVAEVTFFYWVFVSTNSRMRSRAKALVREHDIQIVHQVTPVSPKQPSYMHGLGVPVVIGPMNGGMEFPPAFRKSIGKAERAAYGLARSMASLANRLTPGKRKASLLLAANERTEAALREVLGPQAPIARLVENGVDLESFCLPHHSPTGLTAHPCFVFLGRLVDWKGVSYLLSAFARLIVRVPAELVIVGDGEDAEKLKAQARDLGIRERVTFTGFVEQEEVPAIISRSRALVLPSIYECGGAVVLEAMAMGKAVIATKWGGPADYVDPSCGILVEPSSPEGFVEGLASAMETLALDPPLATRMGTEGRRKVERLYDWDRKADAMLDIYRDVIAGN